LLRGDDTENYVRAKIYTKKGVENGSILAFDHGTGSDLSGLAARVVKPNGTVVELTKNDFHDSVLWKRGDVQMSRTSFAFPNLQPGDVVEYRWRQEVPQWLFNYYRFYCQAEKVFTREYSFEVKSANVDYTIIWENCPTAESKPGSNKVVIRNLPPFVKESFMPPEAQFRGCVTMIYTHPWMRLLGFDADWELIGGARGVIFLEASAPTKPINAKAAELTAHIVSPEECVARIYKFVQTEIKNLDDDPSPELIAARKKRARSDEAQKPAQTLEKRSGTSWDITLLFASLVRAAGYDVRLGMSGDSEQVHNINVPKGWMLADRQMVAVNFGNSYRFYTPANSRAPCGLLERKD